MGGRSSTGTGPQRGLAWLWCVWAVATVVGLLWFVWPLLVDEPPEQFLPGPTSHGHHQIEMACGACHSDAFGGGEVLQSACISCHGDELKAVRDSHPKAKFTNPRNADRIEQLDARYCVTCHVEHQPDKTEHMGVTMPEDFCYECHQDVAEVRPSHEGMGFDTCASSGCHNFHDNQALYEDFLLEHASEPMFKEVAAIVAKNAPQYHRQLPPVTVADAPAQIDSAPEVLSDWQHSGHAQAGVNCSSCHADPEAAADAPSWVASPDHTVCASCHSEESRGFLAGKHGMRLAQGLPAMTVAEARIPMHADSAHLELSCNSCHSPHAFDVQRAAVDSCVGCHNSNHVQNFANSPHAGLTENPAQPGSEQVTCATCHMPRTTLPNGRVVVEHNQNANLRPNEKMLRGVCMNCHSLSFSIDALADPALIDSNFKGRPSVHIPSVDMAVERDKNRAVKPSLYN